MSIYEIEQAILDLVDLETGEITDFEAFEALNFTREEKIEKIALWIKNLNAEAKAIREEEKNLAERRRISENKSESLKMYLEQILNGEKFSTSKVSITYRKSSAVEITDEEAFINSADMDYLVTQPPRIDRKAITEAIKLGKEIKGAELVERNSIQIK